MRQESDGRVNLPAENTVGLRALNIGWRHSVKALIVELENWNSSL